MSEDRFQVIFTTCYIIRNLLSESFSIVEDVECRNKKNLNLVMSRLQKSSVPGMPLYVFHLTLHVIRDIFRMYINLHHDMYLCTWILSFCLSQVRHKSGVTPPVTKTDRRQRVPLTLKVQQLLLKNEDHVQHRLSNNTQDDSFPVSLSFTCHSVVSKRLTSQSTSSPSVLSKSSSVTC